MIEAAQTRISVLDHAIAKIHPEMETEPPAHQQQRFELEHFASQGLRMGRRTFLAWAMGSVSLL
jgi:hypothetical protein